MNKPKYVNRWLWKWHMIAGLISLPFIFLLAITGSVYLFKADVNNSLYKATLFAYPTKENASIKSYDLQLAAVKQFTNKPISQLILFDSPEKATGFRLAGKGHAKNMVYVDPYSAKVTGQIDQKQTLMYLIRKLHGELLLNLPGTLVIELVASWCIVLVLTGLYVWWPKNRFSAAGLFMIRFRQGRKTLWRDLHSVLGFWLSIFMLVILSGGMPWTEVFGSQLKWVQSNTNTGYPITWHSSKGIAPLPSSTNKQLSLDEIVKITRAQNMPGDLTIKLPTNERDVFTASNKSFWLSDQRVIHFDQYSGAILKSHTWSDVGILMEMRQIAMRLHQGEYGLVNWIIVLLVALLFAFSTSAGLVSYLIRKPKGNWGLPTVPAHFRVGQALIIIIIALGVLFPMFGMTIVLIWLYERWRSFSRKTEEVVSVS